MQTQKLIADNLFIKNDCLWFDRAKASLMFGAVPPPLAAVCIVSGEPELPREMELLDKACAQTAAPLLYANERLGENYNVWLLLAHGPWQANSVMVKHRKLWRSFPSAWQLDDFHLCSEFMVASHKGVRFVSVAKVNQAGLFTASQMLRSESSGALILSQSNYCDSRDDVMRLFNSAFPGSDGVAQERIDWLNLSLACCPLNEIVIRVSGSWDEREASLDLIMLPEHLPRFDF